MQVASETAALQSLWGSNLFFPAWPSDCPNRHDASDFEAAQRRNEKAAATL